MKIKSVIATAALLGVLSTPAFALTTVAPSLEKPAPIKVVHPTDLPRSHIGAVVRLQFTVDAAGQPRDIRIVSPGDQAVAPRLVAAVAQWRFTPARQNGVAVSSRVEMPLELIEG